MNARMIKIVCGLVIGLSMLPVEAQAGSQVGWFKRTFGTLNWNEVVDVVETPEDIAARVRHNVDYRADVGDEWADAETTWERGYGDCEDLAATVVELAEKTGIAAEVIVLYPKGSWEAHAIAVGRLERGYWVASNGWYSEAGSLADIKKEVAKEQGWRGKDIGVKTLQEAAAMALPDDRQIAGRIQ